MTTKEHQPYMQFYGDDFWSSETVLRLRPEDQMLYLRLLWLSCKEGSIPADTKILARMLGLTHRRFLRLWVTDELRQAFRPAEAAPVRPARLVNARMERVRGDEESLSAKRARAGAEGARVTNEKKRRDKEAASAAGNASANGSANPRQTSGNGVGKPPAKSRPPTPSPTPMECHSSTSISVPVRPPGMEVEAGVTWLRSVGYGQSDKQRRAHMIEWEAKGTRLSELQEVYAYKRQQTGVGSAVKLLGKYRQDHGLFLDNLAQIRKEAGPPPRERGEGGDPERVGNVLEGLGLGRRREVAHG